MTLAQSGNKDRSKDCQENLTKYENYNPGLGRNLVGDSGIGSGSGKTSLLVRFSENEFYEDTSGTIDR